MTTGFVDADDFSTVAALLTYCAANVPVTVTLQRGEYDFTGLEIPTGATFIGVGLMWNSSLGNGGFAGGSIIKGGPVQSLGSSGNKFSGVVFDGGLTVRKQYTYFEDCGFTGGSLVFDAAGASPYGCNVSGCVFRGITTGPCIKFMGSANANRIVNSTILVAQGQRGVEAVKVSGASPTSNSIIGCDLERYSGVTSIGSFVYGDFHNLTFMGNYMDMSRPTFTDGADIVLSSGSRGNRIWLPNRYGDKYLDSGFGNAFFAPSDKHLYIGGAAYDLAGNSGLAEMIIVGGSCAELTLPPVQTGYVSPFKLVCERSAGTTIEPAGADTINGAGALVMSNGEGYQFYTRYAGSAVTDWVARKIW